MRKYFCLFTVALLLGTGAAYLRATGNLAPSGPHYNLNIIGVTQGKTAPLTGSDRHTIFVPLVSDQQGDPDTLATDTAPILLTQGPFTVCDGNAFDAPVLCDGTVLNSPKLGAVFQLPCNNLNTLGLIVPHV